MISQLIDVQLKHDNIDNIHWLRRGANYWTFWYQKWCCFQKFQILYH